MAINEIKTVLTFGKTSYHERFHKLFGNYILSLGYFWYNSGAVRAVTTAFAGDSYFIHALGNTDFTLIGAPENAVGILFTATGPGNGTGTLSTVSDGVALQETNTQAARFLRGL